LATAIGGIDRLIFTGGIGEHQPFVRAKILQHLAWLGILFDVAANQSSTRCISASESSAAVFIIDSDEQYELYLAAQNIEIVDVWI
jgi:acetate kinase